MTTAAIAKMANKTRASWARANRIHALFVSKLNEDTLGPAQIRSFFSDADPALVAQIDAGQRFRDPFVRQLYNQIQAYVQARLPAQQRLAEPAPEPEREEAPQDVKGTGPSPPPWMTRELNGSVLLALHNLASVHGGIDVLRDAINCLEALQD